VGELTRRRTRLDGERTSTLQLLRALAKERGASTRFLQLAPRADVRRLLGVPAGIEACVFNLDGVLIESAALHAAAWTQAFDELIWARTERTHGTFAPFNPVIDYPRYLHGRPRLDGVRAFLASRGIRLPEGSSSDPAGAETVHGLATRKNEILRSRVDDQGVAAFTGVAHYLGLAGEAGIRRAVVSASANTQTLLHRSGLESLVDCRIDGNTMAAERLRAKPAPDTLLAACRALDVETAAAAVFEDSLAGVQAARAAGIGFVVGVDRGGHADGLRERGADVVVADLGDLLAPG